MTSTETEWLTRREASRRGRLGLRTVDRMLADGRLTKNVDRLGRVRINAGELDQLTAPQPADRASA